VLVRISETLYRAADHIEQNGWYQGYFWPIPRYAAEAPYTAGDPCCAMGAIAVVEDVDPVCQTPDAMRYLAEHLGYEFAARVADWNDMPERTKDEVLAALRGAAERAERAGK
jgi:hypothetical protein